MDIHHLKVFRAAARSSSFTAAGHGVSLSQSTVSLHIKQLEDEFGCSLFIRSGRRVSLSDAGHALLPCVDRIFGELKNAEQVVREFSTRGRGRIRFGVGPTQLIYLLPKILFDFRRQFPAIEVVLSTAVSEVLLPQLLNQTIDLAIVMSSGETLRLADPIPLMKEELFIVLSSENPLALKPELSPKDVAELVFISHLRGTAMRALQEEYFERLGIRPRIVVEMENMEAIKSMVSGSMGSCLLPLSSGSESHGRGLVHKRVRGLSMFRELLIAARDWSTQPPATLRLARFILRELGTPEAQKIAAGKFSSRVRKTRGNLLVSKSGFPQIPFED